MPGAGWSFIDHEEVDAVTDVVRSRQLSRYRFDAGPDATPSYVYRFEREMEKRLEVRHTLAVNSGTSALLVALVAAGVGPGDEVIVPGYTFVATISAVVYARATPVLAEIDGGLTIDPEDVVRKITPRTRAVIAVHMLGAPANMSALSGVCERHGLLLIEDVAQAGGGSFEGRALGSIGIAGAFSLNVFKTFTAGDGGFLTTNDSTVYRHAFGFHDHGFQPLRVGVAPAADASLGLNLKMPELVGAVAYVQATKLDHILGEVRARQRAFSDALGCVSHAARRLAHDPGGDCGTVLAYTFDTRDRAQRVAEALSSRTLIETGRHYYANMEALVARRAWIGETFPAHGAIYDRSAGYGAGTLPRTDDLLARTVALSVGVRDSYLGAGFGIEVSTPLQEIDAAAREFHRLTAAALGR